MKIEQWPVDKPVPYEKNPRINDGAVEATAKSIEAFGFRQPIVVDKAGVIVVGHTRLKAAKALGLKEVPVHVGDFTEAEAMAYRIADNKTGELAEWDEELLAAELAALEDLDFDLDLTGFGDFDRDGEGTEGNTDADDVPEPPEDPVAKRGQIWKLGKHRLMCGDSTSKGDVERLMGGGAAHLMVTDPPYGVEYDANWRNEADRANGKKIGARAVGKVTSDDRADWREAWELFAGDVAYVWHSNRFSPVVAESLVSCGFEIRELIVWAKSNFAISRGHYHAKHEPCWYVVRKGATGHWNGDRSQTTLWEIDKPMKSETGHSTQKPVECMAIPIRNNSKAGDSVYDPFCGSGTTIIAAEQLGRCCYGMEIAPEYCDVIIRRWEEFTGKKAELVEG